MTNLTERVQQALPFSIPRGVRRVLRRALQVDPSKRFITMSALLSALEHSQRVGWRAVALSAGVSVAVIAGILASQEQRARPRLEVPALAPAADAVELPLEGERFDQPTLGGVPAERDISLTVGLERVLQVDGLTRVAVGDVAIVDVQTTGDASVLLLPLARGTTSLQVWAGARRFEYRLHVRAPKVQPEGSSR